MGPENATRNPFERTPDGSLTVWSERFGEHYHDRNGALTQARTVFLEGSRSNRHPAPRVLEVGFGFGLNFLTTLASARDRGVPLVYRALECLPVAADQLALLTAVHPAFSDPLWQKVLAAWPALPLLLSDGNAVLEVIRARAETFPFEPGWASAVYLDAFSPRANPELWSDTFLGTLAGALAPGGWLATYSAAGHVRRALAAAGLVVERRRGLLPHKKEFLCAQRPPVGVPV